VQASLRPLTRTSPAHEFHEAVLIIDTHILLNAEANLVDVGRLRALDVGGNGEHLETQVHMGPPVRRSD